MRYVIIAFICGIGFGFLSHPTDVHNRKLGCFTGAQLYSVVLVDSKILENNSASRLTNSMLQMCAEVYDG